MGGYGSGRSGDADCRKWSYARFAAPNQDGVAEGRFKNVRPVEVDIGQYR
jgi:hypothetical protein